MGTDHYPEHVKKVEQLIASGEAGKKVAKEIEDERKVREISVCKGTPLSMHLALCIHLCTVFITCTVVDIHVCVHAHTCNRALVVYKSLMIVSSNPAQKI